LSLSISKFSENIVEKKAVIGVLGLGQVGLPTALCVLNANYKVIGVDRDKNLVNLIASGKSPFPESGFENLIKDFLSSNLLTVSTSSSLLSEADIIFVCVPTPLDKMTLEANLSYLKNALTEISVLLNKPKLVIIESTVPPNTIRDIMVPHLENISGKKAGRDFLLSYCPERISPGNSLSEFTNNSRIIGADDEDSLKLTNLFLKNITKGKILLSDSRAAELSKLAENSFRDLNIAFANELAIICEQSGADVLDVIRLANSHPRVNIHFPGAGVGGPCLTKDPYMLIQGKVIDSSLIRLARITNDSMPNHVVKTLLKVLNSNPGIDNYKILILGVAYKPGVNDTRRSPTIDIIDKLKENNMRNIFVHDPFVAESFGATRISGDLSSELKEFDCIITVTAHAEYKEFDKTLFKDSCIIVDAARIFQSNEFENTSMTYLPLGSR
jgi:UDP-N-acetyl-D-mannosaminuronic acid dehydrogenase